MEIVKNCWFDNRLRASFCELSEKCFGLNFEDWYQNGFWGEQYRPYSMIQGDEVLANVSVNLMDFWVKGQRRRLIQLGTVMTREQYRNRGLIRSLMEEIEKDYENAEGIYLFANDSVLDFYPKFGFRRAEEYQFSRRVSNTGECEMIPVSMREKEAWRSLEQAVAESVPQGSLVQTDNRSLIMFYVTKFMQENVYCHREKDMYVIAGAENGELLLYNIFAGEQVDTDSVIAAFGKEIKHATLGFTPSEEEAVLFERGYEKKLLQQEDTALFVKGGVFDSLLEGGRMFPLLSYA